MLPICTARDVKTMLALSCQLVSNIRHAMSAIGTLVFLKAADLLARPWYVRQLIEIYSFHGRSSANSTIKMPGKCNSSRSNKARLQRINQVLGNHLSVTDGSVTPSKQKQLCILQQKFSNLAGVAQATF